MCRGRPCYSVPVKRQSIFALITLLVLLALLLQVAYLQYQWQGQVSQGLRNQMQDQMRRAASQFAEDFDNEITRIYETFQGNLLEASAADPKEQIQKQLVDDYRHWNEAAPYPRLLRDLYFVPGMDPISDTIQRVNPGTGRFEAMAWPPELTSLRRTAPISIMRIGGPGGRVLQVAPNYDRSIPALEIPIAKVQASMFLEPIDRGKPFATQLPRALGETIIRLDLDYLRNEFIPTLAKRHLFNPDGTSAYSVAVVEGSPLRHVIYSNSESVDANAAGDVMTDFFVARPMQHQLSLEHPAGDSKREGFVSVQIQRTERLLGASSESSPWKLIITHRAGSLDAAVTQAREKNLAVGFGILLLLAVSIVLTLASVQRERRLARQQMEFVSAVSHELRTPLAVICSAGENLADGVVQDSTRTREYGALVRNEGRRLTEMVEQVLDFAGIQSGKKTYRSESIDVRDLLDSALSTFDIQIREKAITVEKQVQPDLPFITGDRAALVRLLQNLIGNALKYADSGKWLSIRAESASGQLDIIVEDHGPGISPADLPHLFEPFYRGRSAVDAQIKGSGLGLSLVKQIAEAHGGSVAVESVADRGTLFRIRFSI